MHADVSTYMIVCFITAYKWKWNYFC